MLFNEPKLLKCRRSTSSGREESSFSALQRAEIAEICGEVQARTGRDNVSVLFNEPKLLKCTRMLGRIVNLFCFSALQRAEIAEIPEHKSNDRQRHRFSALQRAEIAEIQHCGTGKTSTTIVSVLFNEPKLLKFGSCAGDVPA